MFWRNILFPCSGQNGKPDAIIKQGYRHREITEGNGAIRQPT
jgi:hypothetical protein